MAEPPQRGDDDLPDLADVVGVAPQAVLQQQDIGQVDLLAAVAGGGSLTRRPVALRTEQDRRSDRACPAVW